MGGQWVQFLAGGLTAGAIYALVALGFSIIYNASRVLNFAQGEFVMIGGMSAVSLVGAGAPMPVATSETADMPPIITNSPWAKLIAWLAL